MIKITNFWLQKVKAKLYEIRRCAPLFTQYKINTKTICNPQYKINGKTIGNSQRKINDKLQATHSIRKRSAIPT